MSEFIFTQPIKYRVCTKCKEKILVGKNKIGRVVFPGGICYQCWKRKPTNGK